MKKILLAPMLLSAVVMMAQDDVTPPQTGFYISGLNGATTATENNTLAYLPSDDPDDIEEGIFRYKNTNVEVTGAGELMIVGLEGLKLGYDPDNFMGSTNELGDKSTMMYLTEDGSAINCTLSAGSYTVILASMYDFEDDTKLGWSIQFTNNDNYNAAAYTYYIVGFNGEDAPSQENQFVMEDVDGYAMYSFPKFYISWPADFLIVNGDGSESYGAENAEINDPDNTFALLTNGGDPIKFDLAAGYYTVNFINMGFMSMVTFLYCEDQSAPDQVQYELIGFSNGPIALERVVKTESYEDEDEGLVENESIYYIAEKVSLESCPDGLQIVEVLANPEDEGPQFVFGVLDMMASLGMGSITEMGIGFLGINGSPIGWEMSAGEYNITVFINETMGSISFEPYEEDGDEGAVDSIGKEENVEPVYYDLQGRRINNPDKGIFIKKTGDKVVKIVK